MLSLKVLEGQIRVGLRCYHIALANMVLFRKASLFNAFCKEVKYLCTFEMYRENLFQYFCTVKSFNFFPLFFPCYPEGLKGRRAGSVKVGKVEEEDM